MKGAARTDPELLSAAMTAARVSTDTFAIAVLDVEPEWVRGWLAGDRPMRAGVRALCIGLVDRPALATDIRRERAARLKPDVTPP